MSKRFSAFVACIMGSLTAFGQASTSGAEMVPIPAGSFIPQFRIDSQETHVEPFMLDAYPVTNEEYLDFLAQNEKWKPVEIPPLFADEGYLRQFTNGLQPGNYTRVFLKKPVTNVSWFAARAYCVSVGKRLPTASEWEFAALASPEDSNGFNQPEYYQVALDWYSRPANGEADTIGSTFRNYYGVYDMHGLIWEWVSDFNSAMVFSSDQRNQKIDRNLFCAAGSQGAADVKNYVAFMRYAFRSSLKAKYTVGTLGFRCAKSIEP